jgi:thiol-disulfide isomerase/thioredoxin
MVSARCKISIKGCARYAAAVARSQSTPACLLSLLQRLGGSIVLAALLLASPALADDATVDLMVEAPKAAPELKVKDAIDQFRTLDLKQNKLTIIHFWATWCVPCVAELPKVDSISETYSDKDLRIITVSLDGGNMSKIKIFFADHQITHLKAYLDANNAAFKAFGLQGLPTSVFINQKGEEIARASGPVDWSSKPVIDFIEKTLDIN